MSTKILFYSMRTLNVRDSCDIIDKLTWPCQAKWCCQNYARIANRIQRQWILSKVCWCQRSINLRAVNLQNYLLECVVKYHVYTPKKEHWIVWGAERKVNFSNFEVAVGITNKVRNWSHSDFLKK